MIYGAKHNPHDPGLAIKHIAEAAINTYAELFEHAAAEPSLEASGRVGDKRSGDTPPTVNILQRRPRCLMHRMTRQGCAAW